MKKILALVIALVLSLGLATTAFAAVTYHDLTNVIDNDTDSSYHNQTPAIKDADTVYFSACFDGEAQSGDFEFVDSAYFLGNDNLPIVFGSVDVTADTTTYQAFLDAEKAVIFDAVISQNAEYVSKLTITPFIVWDNGSVTRTSDQGAKDAAIDNGTSTFNAYLAGFNISVTPVDYVIAENKTVKGYFYAYNNHAQSTYLLKALYFEIELYNHYVDQYDTKSAAGVLSFSKYFVPGIGLDGNPKDLLDVTSINKALILHRHYDNGNTTTWPAYVITTEQFQVLRPLTKLTVEYTGLVSVALSDAYAQTGLNFKYDVKTDVLTTAQIYLNPTADTYMFKFLSTEALDSQTVVTLKDAAAIRSALGYTAADKAQPIFVYYSADKGATWTLTASSDFAGKDLVEYTIPAGNVLGWYLLSDTELKFAAADGKGNVGTGASDMVSVCVALAVVSLVAAGAVCVKKVSK